VNQSRRGKNSFEKEGYGVHLEGKVPRNKMCCKEEEEEDIVRMKRACIIRSSSM
jgi:hypothetical protein